MSFSVTTPIYYVNADPHLGHAYTTVAADVLARYRRATGESVFFLTGTDEHGGNVARAAEAAGMEPKAFCDMVSARFRKLAGELESSHDFFIRTTDPEHERRVQEFVEKLRDTGELYEGTYAGLYCSSCEQFYAEGDLIQPGNICPQHNRPVEWVEEKNWFFPLTKWAPRLLELYDQNPDFVRPRARYNEARSLIAGGLEDVSFSRAGVSWGVPLPWDPAQTIYVWVDALLNYRTALEYGLGHDVSAEFWPTSLHIMAKDILRLHGIVWPAMLLAAGYEPPQGLFVHGYFTSGGQKMSKTMGNVIDPFEVIDRYGADALRFYLLREVQWGQDGDVTWDGVHRRYEGELGNDLGNLVSRATNMIGRYRDGVVPEGQNALASVTADVTARLDSVDLTGALEQIWGLVREANRYVEQRAPWALAKSDDPADARRLDETLYTLADTVRCLAVLLGPYIPAASAGDARIGRRPRRCGLGAGRTGPAGGRLAGHPAAAALPARRRGMIDTHAHLDSCRESPDDLVAEAAAAGVDQILTIGREQAIDLARRFGGVRAVVGWHPHEAEVARPETIVPLLDDPEVVAVGECGLDYFRDYAPRDDQLRVFAAPDRDRKRRGKAAGDPHPRGRRGHVQAARGCPGARGAALLLVGGDDRRGDRPRLPVLVCRQRHLPRQRGAAAGRGAAARRPDPGRDRLRPT